MSEQWFEEVGRRAAGVSDAVPRRRDDRRGDARERDRLALRLRRRRHRDGDGVGGAAPRRRRATEARRARLPLRRRARRGRDQRRRREQQGRRGVREARRGDRRGGRDGHPAGVRRAWARTNCSATTSGSSARSAIPVIVQDASGYVGRPMSIAMQAQAAERVRRRPRPLQARGHADRPAAAAPARRARAARRKIFEGTGGIALVDSYRRGIVGTMPGADLIKGIVALWRALEAKDERRDLRACRCRSRRSSRCRTASTRSSRSRNTCS